MDTDSQGGFCATSRHSGFVTESGGFFEIKHVGKCENFVGSENNGVKTDPYTASWEAYTIHPVNIECDFRMDYCGEIYV